MIDGVIVFCEVLVLVLLFDMINSVYSKFLIVHTEVLISHCGCILIKIQIHR
jgi:hypothetical protein